MKKILFFVFLTYTLFAQSVNTPIEDNNFQKLTSHDELSYYVKNLSGLYKFLTVEAIGQSKEGRTIFAVKFSSDGFDADKKKLKVLIFAQQHGNEQSGKEGALLLIKELLKEENSYLINKLDIAIVPQVNPDGAEADKRRNANGMDLNRNHLILTEPETKALHSFFNKYQFDVTMDVHEYYPYGGEWEKAGFRRNSDEQIGTLTNPNISESIRKYQLNKVYPFMHDYIIKQGFSAHHYLLGGPPEKEFIRRSTFDINDGRQSFGILNTLSFIQEGLNAPDSSIQNMEHRANGQMTGMLALIKYSYMNKDEIQKILSTERNKKTNNKKVSIVMEHVKSGEVMKLPVWSYYTKQDTLITVKNFRPVVKSLKDINAPKAYLIPVGNESLVEWMKNHSLNYTLYKNVKSESIEGYDIINLDSIDFEGDLIELPKTKRIIVKDNKQFEDKYYKIEVTTNNKNLLVLALEPESVLGLGTYKEYSWMFENKKQYPILRIK